MHSHLWRRLEYNRWSFTLPALFWLWTMHQATPVHFPPSNPIHCHTGSSSALSFDNQDAWDRWLAQYDTRDSSNSGDNRTQSSCTPQTLLHRPCPTSRFTNWSNGMSYRAFRVKWKRWDESSCNNISQRVTLTATSNGWPMALIWRTEKSLRKWGRGTTLTLFEARLTAIMLRRIVREQSRVAKMTHHHSESNIHSLRGMCCGTWIICWTIPSNTRNKQLKLWIGMSCSTWMKPSSCLEWKVVYGHVWHREEQCNNNETETRSQDISWQHPNTCLCPWHVRVQG